MGRHIAKSMIVVAVACIVIGVLRWAYSPASDGARDNDEEATSKLTARPDQLPSIPLTIPAKCAPASNGVSVPVAGENTPPSHSPVVEYSTYDDDG